MDQEKQPDGDLRLPTVEVVKGDGNVPNKPQPSEGADPPASATTTAAPTPEGDGWVQKKFRLKKEEDARLDALISYAHKAGYIGEPSIQQYMIFALNCAFGFMQERWNQKGKQA